MAAIYCHQGSILENRSRNERTVRILFLNHNIAQRGGTFYRAYHLGRHLVRRGHSVTLLTISANKRWGFEREASEGVEIIHTPDLLWGKGRTGWDVWDTLWRSGYLRNRHFDIIHAFDSRPAAILPALLCRKMNGGKLVLDWADWWGRGGTQAERSGRLMHLVDPIETFFEEAFRTQADGTTTISQALYERAVALGVKPESARILKQGCDLDSASISDRREARRQLALPENQSLAICVGALMPGDATLFFESLRVLFQNDPTCHVFMIGKHGVQVPDDLRQSGQLTETGFVLEATWQGYVSACDVAIIPMANTLASRARWPSRANPFLAAGRAVVITRVGDLPKLLENERAALVVGHDPVEVAGGCLRLFQDTFLRTQIENSARRVASQLLAWPTIVNELESFYYQVAGVNHS
jgi:glycosyltransferase involved in cell wall biosynthesis